ncbi:MAG: GNAT family N-acetyltransferase [Myxococcota bacterium]
MMALAQLGPGDEADALAFCTQCPERTIPLAGWVADGGLRRAPQASRAWMFAMRAADRRVTGLVYVSDSGIVIPVFDREDGVLAFAELGIRNPHVIRVVVAERWISELLMRAWAPRGFRSRIHRNQLAYVVDRTSFIPPRSMVELSVALPKDLDDIVEASAAMAREEAGDDPQSRNPKLFRNRIRDRIAKGRDLIYREGGLLKFKSNVAFLSPFGGQVEGIYVLPPYRNLGLGMAGTASVTQWILERSARACLLVNEDNQAARHLYAKLGYREVYVSRTTFFC